MNHERRIWYQRVLACAVGLLLVGSLYSVYGIRPLVAEPWQWADDGLYLRHGEAFVRWLNGKETSWLGPYDPVLLSKAPLFGIWLGILHLLHIPLRVAEFALLLLLPWLFRLAVRPILPLSGWRWAVVAIILVGLPSLPTDLRLLRSALQAALGGGCLIAAVGLILRAPNGGAGMAGWAAATGLFFALSYLNREETIWLSPVVISALSAALLGAWSQRSWRTALLSIGCLLGTFALPVAVICALNYHSYGVWMTTARRAPALTRAHQLMTSLEPETRERFLPIPTATRLKAYALSPSFARLQPYLEGPSSDHFAKNPGHLSLNGRPPDGREFFVSTFEFALHSAAFQSGARTPAGAEALFDGIARELKAAIAAGKIHAGSSGPALLAAPLPGDYGRILKQTGVSLRKIYSLDGMVIPARVYSSGNPEDLQRMADLTRTPLAPPKEAGPVNPQETGKSQRSKVFGVLTKLQMLVYAMSTVTVLSFALVVGFRHRRNAMRLAVAFAGLVLCGSMIAFSLSMAVVDVLGFPFLQWGVYNRLGYIPLSVLAAYGMVILFAWRHAFPPSTTA